MSIRKLVTLSIILAILSSCKKNNESKGGGPDLTPPFSYTVNGVHREIIKSDVSAITYSRGFFKLESNYVEPDKKRSGIHIEASFTPGTYDASSALLIYFKDPFDTTTYYHIKTGSLQIDSYDPYGNISGKFQFKGVNPAGDSVNITDGKFNVPSVRY